MKITVVVKNIAGRFSFIPPSDATRQRVIELLARCADKYNGYVSLTLSPPYRKRSSGLHSQNSCIHGYASCIADYTGEDVERVKFYAKRRAFKRGYPPKIDDNGAIIMSPLDGEPLPASSADLDTVQAGYLIDELIQIASELDIVLPLTTE